MNDNREKLKSNKWSIIFFFLILLLTLIIFALISSLQSEPIVAKDVVGGVFIGKINDQGWNQNHYEGISAACEELDMKFHIVEDVEENEKSCREAVKELVEKGCKVIFLTSDGFGSNVKSVIEKYPSVYFYTVSPEAEAENMSTYYGRMYQIRYLSGIIAGRMTKTGKLGYVAAKSTPQVNRGVNAYLLGARSVNPDATVELRFTGDWNDKKNELKAAEKLVKEDGVDVLTNHTSVPVTLDVAEDYGIYSIGYNEAKKNGSSLILADLVFNWDVIYKAILRDFVRGTYKNKTYWWGLSKDAVSLDNISKLVDDETMDLVKKADRSFAEGNDVFVGRLIRSDGVEMCGKNERMSDKALLFDMTWFLKGVEVHE